MKKPTAWQADFLLLCVAFIWGTTFIVVKNALADVTPFSFLALRFSAAFFSLVIFCRPYCCLFSPNILKSGSLIGFFLFMGYAFQTIGLQYTKASNAAFITGLSVVLVPLFSVYISKQKLAPKNYFGAVTAALGIFLLSFDGSYSLHKGDFLVFLCACSFALHIIFVGRYSKRYDTLLLATIQIGVVALVSTFLTLVLPMESWPYSWSGNLLLALGVTAIPATSLALFLQNRMQKYTSPSRTAIIFAMEPVFGALSAWYLGGEILSSRAIIGAVFVLLGILIVELRSKTC